MNPISQWNYKAILAPVALTVGWLAIIFAVVWLMGEPKDDGEPCVNLAQRLLEKRKQGIPFTEAERRRMDECLRG